MGHDPSHICLGPWVKEPFTLPDSSVSVLVRICLQAVVLADPQGAGSIKLGRSYLPSNCPHIRQPPFSILMEACPLKIQPALLPRPVKPGQNEAEKFCLLLHLSPQSQQMRSGIHLADMNERPRYLKMISLLPVPYNYLRDNCVYAVDLCWLHQCPKILPYTTV